MQGFFFGLAASPQQPKTNMLIYYIRIYSIICPYLIWAMNYFHGVFFLSLLCFFSILHPLFFTISTLSVRLPMFYLYFFYSRSILFISHLLPFSNSFNVCHIQLNSSFLLLQLKLSIIIFYIITITSYTYMW